MQPLLRLTGLMLISITAAASSASAQERRENLLELSSGYAGFLDEVSVDHVTVGASWRVRLSRRLDAGPEVVYMHGPGRDRDIFVTAKIVFDSNPSGRVSPYVLADGGIMLQYEDVRQAPFWASEGAISAGGGVRVNVTDRFHVAPEVRIGWEPHLRLGAVAGWRFGRR